MKVLVATEKPFAKQAVDGIAKEIKETGAELVLLEKGTKLDMINAVADADGLIVRSDIVDKEVFDAAKKLKVVVRAGAGYDNIDLATATEKGVCVMNTPGQNSNAVAELVFGMLAMMARNRYNGTPGFELKGKRLGIQAYGQVGRNVARIAKGFDMNISALDPFVNDEVLIAEGVTPIHDIRKLYSQNDVVSLHIPSTPQTKKSINADLVKLMPKNGILVNTARKEIIDEDSLLKVLAERKDIMFISDIKPDAADKFAEVAEDRVFFTPKKMGAQTAEANINAGIAAAKQVLGFIKDGVDRFRVNKVVY